MEQHWTEEQCEEWLDQIDVDERKHQRSLLDLLIRGLKIKQMTRVNKGNISDFTKVSEYFMGLDSDLGDLDDFDFEDFNTSEKKMKILASELRNRLAEAFPQNFV